MTNGTRRTMHGKSPGKVSSPIARTSAPKKVSTKTRRKMKKLAGLIAQ